MASRRQAREIAMQALFSIEVGKQEPAAAIAEVVDGALAEEPSSEATDSVNRRFINELVFGSIEHQEASDAIITPLLRNWSIDRLAVVDLIVLRMAVCELRTMPQTPRAVVINEAIELIRRFSAEESVPFVNGVLAQVEVA